MLWKFVKIIICACQIWLTWQICLSQKCRLPKLKNNFKHPIQNFSEPEPKHLRIPWKQWEQRQRCEFELPFYNRMHLPFQIWDWRIWRWTSLLTLLSRKLFHRLWRRNLRVPPQAWQSSSPLQNWEERTHEKQRNHIIYFEPISKRLTSNSIHELSMTSVWIDVIGAFWRATKRKLYRIVWIAVEINRGF